jgi:hypothetical protein
VRGGLTYREGNYIVEELVATGCLVSMDMVEVNTAIGDIRDVVQTATVATDIIVSALGSTVLSSDQHFDPPPRRRDAREETHARARRRRDARAKTRKSDKRRNTRHASNSVNHNGNRFPCSVVVN